MDKKSENKGNDQGSGRAISSVENVSFPAGKQQRDISEIDRQEGDMDHGELGGNFNKEIKNHEQENNK